MEFLAFGEDWGRHPSSSQHILSVLLERYKVIWINSIGLRRPGLNRRDLLRLREKMGAAFSSLSAEKTIGTTHNPNSEKIPANIIKPLVWPLAQNPLVRKLNHLSLNHQLPPKQQPRIIWAALPSAVDYLSICDSDLVVYYCGDDFSALAGVDHRYVARAEQRLIERADIILACSPALHSQFPAEKTWLVPHGVSLSQFATPAPCPADIDPSRPSVGFYGSLNSWLDQKLLQQLATARPEINFYLLGRVDTDITLLEQADNIHLLPPRHHHQLASYLQHWSMAILPFKDNRQIRACNPLKLREYLAAGCPVISSGFPAAAPYRPLVSIAANQKEWLTAIDRNCQNSPEQRRHYEVQARKRIADESWESRADQVIALIKQQLMYEK